MVKKPPSKPAGKPLCIIHEAKKMTAELYREGEDGFRIHFDGAKAKDRTFQTLPSLLQGLHAIFLEIRMASPGGLHGLSALGKASEDAREDVLAASRKIHSALGTV